MKVLVIGASGVIGNAVTKSLTKENEVIRANHKSASDVNVDLGDANSIKTMFEAVGKVDAIICSAGNGSFGPFNQLSDADYELALNNALMGQINLVRFGQEYLNEGGSITLTSGLASRVPIPGAVTISMTTAALEGFVRAAALELEAVRLNVVSPVFVKETMAMMGMPTDGGLSAEDTAKAYIASIQGTMHGKVLDTPDYV